MSTAVFVGDFEPGSSEWHAARAQGLGGSEIAPVLGLSPWESRFSLWHRKSGLAAPVAENDVMYWGKLLEYPIRMEFRRRHKNLTVLTPGTFRHVDRPWQIANPDGTVYAHPGDHPSAPSELLEIKTARSDDGWGDEGTDEIPIYYRTQCLWYLDVFGLDVCHVAVLIGGSDYREYQVTYSPDEVAFMREQAAEFLASVRDGNRPDIDAHSATYEVLRELHPDIEDVKVDVPDDIALPYLDAIAAHKATEDEKRRATAVLADHMGTARRATYAGEQIAIRTTKGNSLPFVKSTPRKATGQEVSTAA